MSTPANKNSSGVRKPRQTRGHISWERVLSAGADVLAEHGYEGFTLAEVGRRADVSNGTIYWRFESKEALFAAIQEREISRLLDELEPLADDARWATLDLGQQMHATVQSIAWSFRTRLGLMHAFISRASVDQATFERGGVAASRTTQLFSQRLLACRDEINQPDPVIAVHTIVRILVASLTQHVATSRSQHLETDADWDRLVQDLVAVGLAFLKSDTPTAATSVLSHGDGA